MNTKKLRPMCERCNKPLPCQHYKVVTSHNVEDAELKELYEMEDSTLIKLRKLTSILE